MSTTNNSINNRIGTSANNTIAQHIRSASGQWDRFNDQTDVHGYYSGVGSPEGVVAADIGSVYSDTGAGATGVYYKTTDTVNTGWVLNASSTGALIQTVFNTSAGSTTAVAGYVAVTGASVVITPSSATSRVLVTFNWFGNVLSVPGSNVAGTYRLRRNGATTIGVDPMFAIASNGVVTTGVGHATSCTFTFVDSPATTAATTYSLQHTGGAGVTLNSFNVNMIAQEIV